MLSFYILMLQENDIVSLFFKLVSPLALLDITIDVLDLEDQSFPYYSEQLAVVSMDHSTHAGRMVDGDGRRDLRAGDHFQYSRTIC